MNPHRIALLAPATLLAVLVAGPALAADYAVLPGMSNASFTSDAFLETIRGTTSQLGGTISVDLAAPGDATGSVTFPASSLRTGVDLRDEHLRSDDWLGDTDVTFTITSVATDAAALTHGDTVEATVTGELTVKGIARGVTAPARVTYYRIDSDEVAGTYGLERDVIRVATSFEIALDDYGINIPGPLQNKLSNTLQLDVRLTAQLQ